MKERPPAGDDPTTEEEALEFDGTHTDRLDDSYRSRVAVASENPHGTVRFNDRRQSPLQQLTEIDAGSSDASATVKQIKAVENPATSATVKQLRTLDNPASSGTVKQLRTLDNPASSATVKQLKAMEDPLSSLQDPDAGCEADATGLFVKPTIRR